ncbi:MAG: CoA-binding protein [Burkholderiaceae bacterium]|nr:MAG: CoA-binding protein [Burkholderiaceae bacterium]
MSLPEEIIEILKTTQTIAVVGLSANPERPSHYVSLYLQHHGYRILPVNPNLQHVLGQPCVARLEDLSEPVDLVLCFRRSEYIPVIAKSAIAIGAKSFWMQLGIANEESADKLMAAGLNVVQDRCMMVAHREWKAR